MTVENTMTVETRLRNLEEYTRVLAELRVERDDIEARIATLDSTINHTVGVDAMSAKIFSSLRDMVLGQ